MTARKNKPVYNNIPELVEGCYTSLKSLEVTGIQHGKNYHFYRPALTKYSAAQWLWDSGWHMIVWSHRKPENAIAELRSMLQFQQPDGFIPEIIFWRLNPFTKIFFKLITGYSHEEFTDLTQMPMLAYPVRAIWEATGDLNLLREFVPKIVKYMTWWESRDHDNDGLVSIIHPWESGIDASPLYDPVFHLNNPEWYQMYPHFWKLHHTYRRLKWNQETILKKELFNFEDVGVCSVYADGWGILAAMAQEFDNELAEKCRLKNKKYREVVINKCWDNERRQFVSYFHQNGKEKVSTAETIQTLLPLLIDELPEDIKEILVAKIKDPDKFWLPYPVPTVSKSEITFNPDESRLLWRGPMWPATTWLVMEGLLKHGYESEAEAILERWIELCLQNGIWEYYNPITGEGLGQKGLGMSTLIVDMFHRLNMVV
jgi:glycogen debranching enzyme